MTEKIVEQLGEFDEERWVNYIQELCYDLNPSPSLKSISLELISQLFWIYNELDEANREARLLFVRSLLRYFRTVGPQQTNRKLIYDLIYFVHETKPIEHRADLESMVRDTSYKDLSFGSDNLQLLLAKSYIYLEDSKDLVLEEWLRSKLSPNMPYSLYVIMFYYSYLGHSENALAVFSECLKRPKWTKDEKACEEISNALTDCVPQYIDLTQLLGQIIDDDIEPNYAEPPLNKFIGRFIEELKSISHNVGLVLFAEDVLTHTVKNLQSGIPEIIELAKVPAYNELIVSYTDKFLEPSIESDKVLDIKAISEEIIRGDVSDTVAPKEKFSTAGGGV